MGEPGKDYDRLIVGQVAQDLGQRVGLLGADGRGALRAPAIGVAG